jgi:hypothetical protein
VVIEEREGERVCGGVERSMEMERSEKVWVWD